MKKGSWFMNHPDGVDTCVDRAISYELARAIGHPPSRIALAGDCVLVAWMDPKRFKGSDFESKEQREWARWAVETDYGLWRAFDYKDPLVIWPIAKRFDCFPRRVNKKAWVASAESGKVHTAYPARSAEEAVARVMIESFDKRCLDQINRAWERWSADAPKAASQETDGDGGLPAGARHQDGAESER